MFTSTFLGKNPLTRQTRRTFNRSRANLNGPIRNTFIVFCWNQSETILLQGSPELLISLLYMRRRVLGRDCFSNNGITTVFLYAKAERVQLDMFWIGSRLWEVVAYERLSHMEVRLHYFRLAAVFLLEVVVYKRFHQQCWSGMMVAYSRLNESYTHLLLIIITMSPSRLFSWVVSDVHLALIRNDTRLLNTLIIS